MNWDDRYHQAMDQYYRNMTVNLLHRLDSEKVIQEPILFLNGVKALREAGYTAADIIDNIVLELGRGEVTGIPTPMPYYWIRPMRTNGIPLEGDVEFFHYNPSNILSAWKHRLLDDNPLRKTIIGVSAETFVMMVTQTVAMTHFAGMAPKLDFENMLLGEIKVITPE